MNGQRPPSEQDLQAYVDGWLAPTRQAAVEAYLAEHPEEAARIQDYRMQSAAVRTAMRGAESAAVPERLLRATHSGAATGRATWLTRAAAAVLLLAVGFGGGWSLNEILNEFGGERVAGQAAEGDLPRLAAAAHRVYSAEVRHAVEVRAEEAHLLGWLSKRLGQTLIAPNLDPYGYRLMGGRLLPAASGAAAQLMYEDGTGRRLTIYVQDDPEGTETAFRFAEEGGLGAFYWRDNDMGYALVGPLQRAELLDIAEAVYRQSEK
ncbi:MAG TPA: anti-sigma factor [Kiloniellales bacterium]|jgi:anti-sigma factor RsiW